MKYRYLAVFASFATISFSGQVYAENYVHEAFVDTSEGSFETVGTYGGEQMGADVTSGDFNNDGIQDLLTSSPFASYEDKKWNGRVSIIFGKKESIKSKKSERSNEWANVNFYGKNAGDQLGTSLSVGDFDGDGLDDIVIGGYNAVLKSERKGKAYVIYGKSLENRKTFDFSYKEEDLMLSGVNDKDGFGLSVESFDINRDGYDDLLVGAPFASGPVVKTSGLVYVYFGSKEGLKDESDSILYGQIEGERFGSEIAAGNIFGDEKVEIAIGAYFGKNGEVEQAGRIYLFAGRDSFGGGVKHPTSILVGNVSMGWLGFSLDVADVNADGKADIASSYFSYQGDRNEAKVMVMYGDDKFAEYSKIFTTNNKLIDVSIVDPVGEAFLGAKVLLEDLNADGRAEIIAGAPGISESRSVDTGDVYIVYSGTEALNKRYSVRDKEVTSIIHGQDVDDWFGYSLGAGDFNGDEMADLLVGARYADGNGSINSGKVFVVYGENDPIGEEKLANIPYDQISRGEFVKNIVGSFGLQEGNQDFLDNCYTHKDFCFFNFMAISTYEDIKLDPELILYPDVKPEDMYFEAVNVATALGLVNGFVNETDSPFMPEMPISRMQALKVILGAAGLVQPLHRFELVEILGSPQALTKQPTYFLDIDPQIAYMWWCPRYVNFAVENGIVEDKDYFRPDDNLTKTEFNAMVSRTLDYLSTKQNEEVKP